MAIAMAAEAIAAPRIPPSDATVLEHVPAAAAAQKLDALRARLMSHPQDVQGALVLAQGYLDIGRSNADPRFVSYAEATLNPLLHRPDPDPAVLTLAATTLQYLHRFDEALSLLNRALQEQPRNGQAWLTKASILQLQGHFDEGRKACRQLIQSGGQLIALTCLSSVNAMTGKLGASYTALGRIFNDGPGLPAGVRVWILDQLGDMAERSGDSLRAEGYLRRALQVAPQDGYSKAEYADLLLRENRAAEVISLLRVDEQQDNLLLRLAIAGSRLHESAGERWSDEFQARFEAARRDGDYTHLREQARFLLEVRHEPFEALRLAVQNWQVQREPDDIRIYLAAAQAAGNRQATNAILGWIHQTGYEDHALQANGDGIGRPPGG